MKTSRAELKEIFQSSNKRLDVLFHTSNLEKYLQARAVFERFGLQVRHFKGHTEPYAEEYDAGKEALLDYAIDQILKTIGSQSIFFVEDTSLRIEALSTPTSDVPGLSVKEWFQKTSFHELDDELCKRRKGRDVIVKSDIALHVPNLGRKVHFHGETTGSVATKAPNFEHQARYPWLTPRSFNGWFIPEDATKRLGEMSFEESWGYDFRIKAFVQLIERLEELTAALNLPPKAYSRVGRAPNRKQLGLTPQAFIVIGRTCAGKSTFGEQAAKDGEFFWVEASSIVRMLMRQDRRSLSESKERANTFQSAEELLAEKGADIVAQTILMLNPGKPLVITGFRTLEELEAVRHEMPDAKVVLIEASERARFERYLGRARTGHAENFDDFMANDQAQWKFGLLRVADDFADVRVTNEGTLEDYTAQIEAVISGRTSGFVSGVSDQIHSSRRSERSQLYRCLMALETSEGKSLDCKEIQERTKTSGPPIRFNNVNKILKRYPELAARFEMAGHRLRYGLTDAGRTYLRLLRLNYSQIDQHGNG